MPFKFVLQESFTVIEIGINRKAACDPISLPL